MSARPLSAASSVAHRGVKVRTLVTPALGRSCVAPLHVYGTVVDVPTQTTFTTAAATIPAASLVNGLLLFNLASSGALVLPTATAILAAFSAAGVPLVAGDMFRVSYQNISATQAVTGLTMGASLTDGQAVATEAIAIAGNPAESGQLLFYCTSTATPAFTVYKLASNV